MFYSPDLVQPGTSDYLAQSIDIAPTVLRLAHLDVPNAFQGIDLFAKNRVQNNERLAFLTCRSSSTGSDAVVSGSGWKYIHYHDGQPCALQFHPTGLTFEAELSSEFPAVVKTLRNHLQEWRTWQLLYHREPRYHELFFAPRTPELTKSEALVLNAAANKANKHSQK